MKILLAFLFLALLPACAGKIGAFQSTVTITNDQGGLIKNYIAKYRRWAAANKKVVIDGYCGSSCTTFEAIIKPQNVCLTKRAVLGYHGSWGWSWGQKVENPFDTHLMTEQYSLAVNAWLVLQGGLITYQKMIYMKYPTTALFFRIC